MTWKVRLWAEGDKVLCCSSVCTLQSCHRFEDCQETEITILKDDDYNDFEEMQDES